MSYSCSDFTDDVCRALRVDLPPDADDGDVQLLAELAIARILAMRKLAHRPNQVRLLKINRRNAERV